MKIAPTLKLNSGYEIPHLGLGTWPMKGEEATQAVVDAVAAGYRLIDSAFNYENEDAVGEGVRRSGVDRAELFVTTKIPGRHQGYESTLSSCRKSLKNLGLDYLDLYLIHWPLPQKDLYVETWQAFVKLQEEGLVRSIGVSNFKPAHIDRVIAHTDVVPAVNQIQLHPAIPQEETRAYDTDKGIVTEAWSPLGQGANNLFGDDMNVLSQSAVQELAEKYSKTVGQIILRWQIELGNVPVPKSSNPQRMAENIDVFDFTLHQEDMDIMGQFDLGPTPPLTLINTTKIKLRA